jgi:hypothetical protein
MDDLERIAARHWRAPETEPPMIVVPGILQNGAAPAPLVHFLAERSWVLRPGRYHGQDLPPIARTLMMSAP